MSLVKGPGRIDRECMRYFNVLFHHCPDRGGLWLKVCPSPLAPKPTDIPCQFGPKGSQKAPGKVGEWAGAALSIHCQVGLLARMAALVGLPWAVKPSKVLPFDLNGPCASWAEVWVT